jgi:hypothetical protein
MVSKSEMMPTILEKCPAFAPAWKKHREFWGDEEAGVYNDMAEFAQFVVDAYERGDIEPVVAAFAVVEHFLANGDQQVRDAAGIGFLEDVRNIASHRPFGFSAFVQWLGPISMQAWSEIEETWRGKSSLADVVRAERRAQEKPKTGNS